MADQQTTYGATWADLGIEILNFANDETGKFILLFIVIAAIISIGGGILLAVYRGVTTFLNKDYKSEISKTKDMKEEGGPIMPVHLPWTIMQMFVVLLLYGLLRRRLMRMTHAFRIQVGRKAMQWSSDARVQEQSRKSLEIMAHMMYRPISPWLVVVALVVACWPSGSISKNIVSEEKDVAEQVQKLKFDLIVALITTSPLACTAGAIVMIFGLSLRMSIFSMTALYEVISAVGDPIFINSPMNPIRWGRHA